MLKIFGHKNMRYILPARRRIFHNEGLHNLYSSPNIIRVIICGVRWVVHVTYIGDVRNACRILVLKLKRGGNFGGVCVRWKVTLKCILKKKKVH